MHKCQNNSNANVHHLEQFIGDFFPYSQKQLGFDKPITIRFESDDENANVLLGKTAYYDPQALEVVLYVDGRHPKDVMRSLSHELVHHAQNCRGDFHGGCEKEGWDSACVKDTSTGYAQKDPHLRKMEREAYTKGNLIFRDFEDLIKTGKINIEIDFSGSGEPKMSLKEWKDNELNMLLMKKWGLLKESKEVATGDLEEMLDPSDPAYRRKKAFLDKQAEKTGNPRGRLYNKEPADGQQAFSFVAAGEDADEELEEGWGYRKDDDEDPVDEGFMDTVKGAFSKKKTKPTHRTKQDTIKGYNKMRSSAADVEASNILKATQAYLEEPGTQNRGTLKALLQRIKKVLEAIAEKEVEQDAASTDGADERGPGGFRPGAGNVQQIPAMNAAGAATQINPSMREGRSQKISVREAKEITRKIIKRIKKESN